MSHYIAIREKTHKEVFTRIFNTIYHDFSTKIHSFHDLYTLNTLFVGAVHATRSSETIECDSIIFITFQPITHKPIRIEIPSDKKTYAENCDSIKKSEAKIKSNIIQLMKTVYFWIREYQEKTADHVQWISLSFDHILCSKA